MCLANAGLGAVHGFAAPAGGMYDAPHGAVCAALLAAVLEVNLSALRARAKGSPVLERFRELACILTGDASAQPEDGVRAVRDLTLSLHVPGLSRYGMREADLASLCAKAKVASSMKANPVALTDDELLTIARSSL
jgi:alcohol dehydrogenase class IV